MKYIGYFFLVGVVFIFIWFLSYTIRTCNNATETAYQEFKPSELLKKYEWFKDASAALDAKLASLDIYKQRFESLKSAYGVDSLSRNKWSRDDRSQWSIWQSECAGIAASYNQLASEYNSQMSKFNYRFCNKGTLPQGAEIPLPREYKPYIYAF